MTTTQTLTPRTYPCTVRLSDNTPVTLRLMDKGDADRVLQFARHLPEDDLHFLRLDLTDPQVVRQWLAKQAAGQSAELMAEVQGEMAGYASLHYNQTNWQRHLGEIRLQVGPRYRGKGLGRVLAAEIFALAREHGLRKLVAQMTADQRGAYATFERLGFQPEALLQDFVIDRDGRTRDLVVMSHDVEGLTDRVD